MISAIHWQFKVFLSFPNRVNAALACLTPIESNYKVKGYLKLSGSLIAE
jgi:hypothetical protein